MSLSFLLTRTTTFPAQLALGSPVVRLLHKQPGTNDDFSRMLKSLETTFKKPEVRTKDVRKVLKAYNSDEEDWKRFAYFDIERYTRNLVFRDERFQAILLCWMPGQESSIHDHANAHCWVKVLQGEMTETRFLDSNTIKDQRSPLKKAVVKKNAVTYMHDSLGFHVMANLSRNPSVTLHIYSPPFTACNSFDRTTGEKKLSTMNFNTVEGKKFF